MENEESIENYINREKIVMWKDIISHYSGRDLSVFEDRLPALAGIASELSKYCGDIFMMGDNYLSGFWQETLIQHLGWRGKGRKTETGRQIFANCEPNKRIGMPMWSWATLTRRIRVPIVWYPDAIDCQIEPVFEEVPFGQVRSGILTLDALTGDAVDWKDFAESHPTRDYTTGWEIAMDFPELGWTLGRQNCYFWARG
jgi:hypothetical protein